MSKYDVNKFKQVTVALNTPFQPDGSVDLKAVRAVVNYFYNKGKHQASFDLFQHTFTHICSPPVFFLCKIYISIQL